MKVSELLEKREILEGELVVLDYLTDIVAQFLPGDVSAPSKVMPLPDGGGNVSTHSLQRVSTFLEKRADMVADKLASIGEADTSVTEADLADTESIEEIK